MAQVDAVEIAYGESSRSVRGGRDAACHTHTMSRIKMNDTAPDTGSHEGSIPSVRTVLKA
jgi:hypothetical protein